MFPSESKPVILFYCATGRGLGLGHLYRCRMLLLTLAGPGSLIAVKPERSSSAFLDSSPLVWQAVEKHLAGGSLGLRLAGIAVENGAQIVVLDCKDTSLELVLSLRQSGLTVVDLEDLGPGRMEADLLLDPHIQPGSSESAFTGRAECCFGPSWALLDPVYAGLRNGSSSSGRCSALTVTVSLGGSDPSGLTGRVIEALAGVDADLNIEVALGPAAEPGLLPESSAHVLRIHRALPCLADLLCGSDLAFVGGGISMFESLCLGVPTVVVPQHDEQFRNASRLAQRSALLLAPPPSDATAESELSKIALSICADPALRNRLACTGATLVDGLGVERLERKISLLNKNQPGKLAPARR